MKNSPSKVTKSTSSSEHSQIYGSAIFRRKLQESPYLPSVKGELIVQGAPKSSGNLDQAFVYYGGLLDISNSSIKTCQRRRKANANSLALSSASTSSSSSSTEVVGDATDCPHPTTNLPTESPSSKERKAIVSDKSTRVGSKKTGRSFKSSRKDDGSWKPSKRDRRRGGGGVRSGKKSVHHRARSNSSNAAASSQQKRKNDTIQRPHMISKSSDGNLVGKMVPTGSGMDADRRKISPKLVRAIVRSMPKKKEKKHHFPAAVEKVSAASDDAHHQPTDNMNRILFGFSSLGTFSRKKTTTGAEHLDAPPRSWDDGQPPVPQQPDRQHQQQQLYKQQQPPQPQNHPLEAMINRRSNKKRHSAKFLSEVSDLLNPEHHVTGTQGSRISRSSSSTERMVPSRSSGESSPAFEYTTLQALKPAPEHTKEDIAALVQEAPLDVLREILMRLIQAEHDDDVETSDDDVGPPHGDSTPSSSMGPSSSLSPDNHVHQSSAISSPSIEALDDGGYAIKSAQPFMDESTETTSSCEGEAEMGLDGYATGTSFSLSDSLQQSSTLSASNSITAGDEITKRIGESTITTTLPRNEEDEQVQLKREEIVLAGKKNVGSADGHGEGVSISGEAITTKRKLVFSSEIARGKAKAIHPLHNISSSPALHTLKTSKNRIKGSSPPKKITMKRSVSRAEGLQSRVSRLFVQLQNEERHKIWQEELRDLRRPRTRFPGGSFSSHQLNTLTHTSSTTSEKTRSALRTTRGDGTLSHSNQKNNVAESPSTSTTTTTTTTTTTIDDDTMSWRNANQTHREGGVHSTLKSEAVAAMIDARQSGHGWINALNWTERIENVARKERVLPSNAPLSPSPSLPSVEEEFCRVATSNAQTIVDELWLPDRKKTIKPIALGGIAGGAKYVKNGILYKLAQDTIISLEPKFWMYGGNERADEHACKAAGNEMLSAQLIAAATPHMLDPVDLEKQARMMHARFDVAGDGGKRDCEDDDRASDATTMTEPGGGASSLAARPSSSTVAAAARHRYGMRRSATAGKIHTLPRPPSEGFEKGTANDDKDGDGDGYVASTSGASGGKGSVTPQPKRKYAGTLPRRKSVVMLPSRSGGGKGEDTRQFRVPPMCLIDYCGHRVLAMGILPIAGRSSLVYGSCDGGVNVKASHSTVNAAMDVAGERIGIAKHVVSAKILATPGDFEVHQGYDGHYYGLDFGRVLPPEAPLDVPLANHPDEGVQAIAGGNRRVFYHMLRPELLARYRRRQHTMAMEQNAHVSRTKDAASSKTLNRARKSAGAYQSIGHRDARDVELRRRGESRGAGRDRGPPTRANDKGPSPSNRSGARLAFSDTPIASVFISPPASPPDAPTSSPQQRKRSVTSVSPRRRSSEDDGVAPKRRPMSATVLMSKDVEHFNTCKHLTTDGGGGESTMMLSSVESSGASSTTMDGETPSSVVEINTYTGVKKSGKGSRGSRRRKHFGSVRKKKSRKQPGSQRKKKGRGLKGRLKAQPTSTIDASSCEDSTKKIASPSPPRTPMDFLDREHDDDDDDDDDDDTFPYVFNVHSRSPSAINLSSNHHQRSPESPSKAGIGETTDHHGKNDMDPQLRIDAVKGISSDAFTGWAQSDPMRLAHELSCARATKWMLTELVSEFSLKVLHLPGVKAYLAWVTLIRNGSGGKSWRACGDPVIARCIALHRLPPYVPLDTPEVAQVICSNLGIASAFHAIGCNMRHLGRLRREMLWASPEIASLILTICCARAAKHVIATRARKCNRTTASIGFRNVAFEHLQAALFRDASQNVRREGERAPSTPLQRSKHIWVKLLKDEVVKRFPYILSPEERQEEADLRGSTRFNGVDVKLYYLFLSTKLGIRMKPSALTHFWATRQQRFELLDGEMCKPEPLVKRGYRALMYDGEYFFKRGQIQSNAHARYLATSSGDNDRDKSASNLESKSGATSSDSSFWNSSGSGGGIRCIDVSGHLPSANAMRCYLQAIEKFKLASRSCPSSALVKCEQGRVCCEIARDVSKFDNHLAIQFFEEGFVHLETSLSLNPSLQARDEYEKAMIDHAFQLSLTKGKALNREACVKGAKRFVEGRYPHVRSDVWEWAQYSEW